jgi:Glyoxalase-like domain
MLTMRLIVLLSVMLLTLCGSQQPVSAETPTPLPTKLDHILLWGRSIDEVTAILAVKLGFQIRPGHDPGGVANRYVRFSDRGYLELLGITRPNPDMDPGMRADQTSLHGAAGSRSFGIYSSALDQVRTALLDRGFAVTPVFTAPTANPDGGGPLKPSPPDWRLFAFEHSPLSSNLFFIDYAPSYAMQTKMSWTTRSYARIPTTQPHCRPSGYCRPTPMLIVTNSQGWDSTAECLFIFLGYPPAVTAFR